MAAANTKKLPFPQEGGSFFTIRLDVEQAEKGTAKKGNPGQDPQSRSTELQEFLDFDPSKTAGEGRGVTFTAVVARRRSSYQ